MILVDSVSKKYGQQHVLNDVSFRVKGGEFVSIVGSSGAGKTTLLYALIGAVKPDKGKITVDNYDVSSLGSGKIQEYRRRIGIVFQDYKLLPQKTVFENVAFALEVAGYDGRFINRRVADVLKITGMEEHRNNFPRELSGGERQRTAIARALVHAPELLFADEPTGNLDPENTIALAKLFQKINKSGTTIILATHDRDMIGLCNKRIITLDNGRLVSDKRNS
ncbi:ATP-binding cassette domain-containing protein [Candidatus Peregrinibacteria bacterium]|nr:ATP-binding cassette domain-containing protein [Candidatus Peregrinibacteria bacterium]